MARNAGLVSTDLPRPRPLRMIGVTAVWGACFVAIQFGLKDAPVFWFAALRALLAGAVLLAAGLLMRRPAPPSATWPRIAVLGLFNVTIAFAGMFAGTAGVASGVAAMLANAQPLLIVLPAWVLFGERPRVRALVGLGVGFVGLYVVAASGGSGGELWALTAAAATTVGTLVARSLGAADVVMLTAMQFLFGGAVLAGWAGLAEGAPQIAWTLPLVGSLAFLALAGTALSYLVWFVELGRARIGELSAWTLLTPVFGVAFGWLFGDRLSTPQLVGAGLVVLALATILLPGRRVGQARP